MADSGPQYTDIGVCRRISVDDMIAFLVPTAEKPLISQFANKIPPPDEPGQAQISDTFCKYFNVLSTLAKADFKADAEYTLEFLSKRKSNSNGHRTKPECKADIAIIRNPAGAPPLSTPLHWCHLEASGETGSQTNEDNSGSQAALYTAFNLQARPDLHTVLGIFVNDGYFQLFATNACAVHQTENIAWSEFVKEEGYQYRRLLSAWMWRLYNPNVDPSITINYTTSHLPTFTIVHKGETYHDLSIIHTGEAIGKRTTVMAQGLDKEGGPVIKEQYIEQGRSFLEKIILKKIHRKGLFPGIVSLASNAPDGVRTTTMGSVIAKGTKDREEMIQNKTRLILNERGNSLLYATTPKEMLMAMYDTLEVSRILFKYRGVFHRDYSKNNILLRNEAIEYKGPLDHDLGDMCFSQYLLAKDFQEENVADDNTQRALKRARLATRLLIIDFDSAEDLDREPASTTGPKPRMGTPIFMAREVRGDMTLITGYEMPGMPSLNASIEERYRKLFPERFKKFPTTEEEITRFKEPLVIRYNQHFLWHEAESIFWNILYWSMTAKPVEIELGETAGNFPVHLSSGYWGALVNQIDMRHNNFIRCETFEKAYLHPAYAGLHNLLDSMRQHLQCDPRLFEDPKKKDDEYIHEVFQRLIINFLVEHEGEKFMNLKRVETRRETDFEMQRITTTTSFYSSTQNTGNQGHI